MKFAAFYLLVLLTLLAGCESRPIKSATAGATTSALPTDSVVFLADAWQAVLHQATLPPDTSAPLIPKLAEQVHAQPQLPAKPYNRRYVGTLGGQPVVLELMVWPGTQNVNGTYYFNWGGQARQVSAQGAGHDQPLFLVESTIPYTPEADEAKDAAQVTGTWQATQRLGPTLTGIWTDKKTRRTARFELHENFDGAVRYEEIHSFIEAKDSCRVAGDLPGNWYYRQRTAAWYSLHLVGPDTLRPAWQRLQCPTPQKRKQQLATLLARTDCSGKAYDITRSKLLNYNGDGLFCWTDVSSNDTDASYPTEHVEEHTYDLVTGQECHIIDWLRPNKLREVRQLATACLLANEHARARYMHVEKGLDKPPYLLAKMPVFLLTSAGIAFRVGADYEEFITFRQPIVIPYAAVAPYVLPGTPLARLVAARARPHQ